jgi:hypothetical protein
MRNACCDLIFDKALEKRRKKMRHGRNWVKETHRPGAARAMDLSPRPSASGKCTEAQLAATTTTKKDNDLIKRGARVRP